MGTQTLEARDLIDYNHVMNLSFSDYWAILRIAINDICGLDAAPVPSNLTPHEGAFAQFAVLMMSAVGGCCWPDAVRYVVNLTFADVKRVLGDDRPYPVLVVSRQRTQFPLALHPIVVYALLRLVGFRMAVRPTRNNALSPLEDGDSLAPYKPGTPTSDSSAQQRYRRGLCAAYLKQVCLAAGIWPAPKLDTFLGGGRCLLPTIYELDVVQAMLGGFVIGLPEPDQLSDTGLLRRLRHPVMER